MNKIFLFFLSFILLFSCNKRIEVYEEEQKLESLNLPSDKLLHKFKYKDWTITYQNKDGIFDGIVLCDNGKMGVVNCGKTKLILKKDKSFEFINLMF